MPKRMLIDASHPEETRVVVLDGQKVEEFDFEAAAKRPLKGNIYLAKVTRVEPSLQAAFVEYGGNRQGFLAFSEIHPDYYQIPVADRQALLAEQQAEARRRSEDEFESIETAVAPAPATSVAQAAESDDADHAADGHGNGEESDHDAAQAGNGLSASSSTESAADIGEVGTDPGFEPGGESGPESLVADETSGAATDQKAMQATRPAQRWMRKRHYKIQEVIKRRQVILVQVVKEERGTKGAALTTYLSLAGRYCVLMPNTPRGGGISRKITSATDRKRLKQAAQALELPEGMGLIIRTAGENRTKTEIKRDYEYLLRMWDTVRDITLKSNAPACVYEEGDLIKRAIRDLYNKDVADIVVEGDEGYRNAKDFMRMLMPSHAKNVKPFKEAIPLFQRHHIEAQLDAMFSPTVTLRSGGYVVINQTEALVAIDVNSGRATREHSIEDTAYKTNLEAAEEIGRQLRLRDLAGLIVIDFIDMEDSRNDRNVEKRLRDCVKMDRARVQIGKISQFGLLEMSRQRLRAGVVAGSTVTCPHCGGQGIVRSVESTALRVLRSLEEEGQRQRAAAIVVRAQPDVAIYTLNQKRRELMRLETEYAIAITFEPKEGIVAGTFELDRIGQKAPEERAKIAPPPPEPEIAPIDDVAAAEHEESSEDEEDVQVEMGESPPAQAPAAEGKRRRRRRRRGREHSSGTGAARESGPASAVENAVVADWAADRLETVSEGVPITNFATEPQQESENIQTAAGESGVRRKRRRRRRGRRGPREGAAQGEMHGAEEGDGGNAGIAHESAEEEPSLFADHVEDDGRARSERKPTSEEAAPLPVANHHGRDDEHARAELNAPSEPVWSLAPESTIPERAERASENGSAISGGVDVLTSIPRAPSADPAETQAAAPEKRQESTRKGWWQRPFRSRE